MIAFQKMAIDDKAIFDRFSSNNNIEISEITFTNLFIWRDHYNIQFAVEDDLLIVIASGSINVEPFAFFPIGKITEIKLKEIVNKLSSYFANNNWKLRFNRVTESQVEFLKSSGFDHVNVIDDPANYDYVYLTEDLVHLNGKKFHDKRNHLNNFNRNYSFEYIPLTKDLIETAIEVSNKQFVDKNGDPVESLEKNAYVELLNNYSSLNCKGALLKVEGKYEALTIGELVNNETAIIHVEKANREIHGLYAMTNQQFCFHEWQDSKFINREQDLGLEGLRKSKLSYNPIMMIKKSIVEF